MGHFSIGMLLLLLLLLLLLVFYFHVMEIDLEKAVFMCIYIRKQFFVFKVSGSSNSCKFTCALNQDSDQPAHPRSRIRVVVVCYMHDMRSECSAYTHTNF